MIPANTKVKFKEGTRVQYKNPSFDKVDWVGTVMSVKDFPEGFCVVEWNRDGIDCKVEKETDLKEGK